MAEQESSTGLPRLTAKQHRIIANQAIDMGDFDTAQMHTDAALEQEARLFERMAQDNADYRYRHMDGEAQRLARFQGVDALLFKSRVVGEFVTDANARLQPLAPLADRELTILQARIAEEVIEANSKLV